jgi:hydroxyethylthiazole kinase-like uncharacterized protein yjeF
MTPTAPPPNGPPPNGSPPNGSPPNGSPADPSAGASADPSADPSTDPSAGAGAGAPCTDPIRPGSPPGPAMHPLLDVDAIREIEARGLAATPPGTLMVRAADAVARACAELLRALPARTPVLALAGPGNNGGDALLAALRLADRGWAVRGLALQPDEPTADDARRVWRQWRARGLPLATPDELERLLAESPLVIDGLFGIGLTRPLPADATAIALRLARAAVTVVAVDLPSGLDADRGCIVGGPGNVAVRADVTVTMIADKPGLHTGAGCDLAGSVRVATLGLGGAGAGTPTGTGAGVAPGASAAVARGHLVDAGAVAGLLAPRRRDAHKGRFGDVLVVSGAPGMRGAAVLAALGAQAVGAGRLYLGLEDGAAADPQRPELMSRRIDPFQGDAELALGRATAIVAGCGLGTDAAARRTLGLVLAHPAALVLDADGLNVVAADAAIHAALAARAATRRPSVLTPHPLEAARLLDVTVAQVQRDRRAAALAIASATGACVVLKGAGSVVATPDGRWFVNGSGGPLLSVAGTGDVLAGTIGGLLAAALTPLDAALLGTWLHGTAADTLAGTPEWAGGIGLPASQLPGAIRAAVNRLAAGRS